MSQESGENGYSMVFREYLRRSVRRALAEARAAESGLPAEQREQALQTLTFALDATDAWPEARDLLVALAPKLDRAGWREEVVPYLLRGMAVSESTGDDLGLAELRLQLAMVHMVMGKLDEAYGELIASAADFDRLEDRRNRVRALNRAAYVARMQRRYPEAAALVETAAALVEPGDSEEAYGDFVAATLALDAEEWTRAMAGFNKSLAGWERLGDTTMIARNLTNLGIALRGAGRAGEAVACYERAIELMEQGADDINVAATRMNLGNVFWTTGQPALALEQYRRAELVFRQANDQLRMASVAQNMGLAYTDLGEFELAQTMFQTSIEYQRQRGNRRGIANSLDGLGVVLRAQGNRVAAEATFREALELLDTLAGQPGTASLRQEVEEHLREMEESES
jgi:tetratricopeptide (TPR) repeat protein